jgi:hypothetical protein
MNTASNQQDSGDDEYQAGLERLRASRERCREEQYSRLFGRNDPSEAMIRGFIDGAVEVERPVKKG